MNRVLNILMVLSLAVVAFGAVAGTAAAQDATPGGTSIQDAVNNANPGETVTVAPGTYDESVNVNVENVTIEASNPSNQPTVVGQGNGLSPTFSVSADDVTLRNLDITSDNTEDPVGVVVSDASGVTVEDNTIRDLSGTGSVGAQGIVVIEQALTNQDGLTVRDNTIEDLNHPRSAAAVRFNNDVSGTIDGNVISDLDTNPGGTRFTQAIALGNGSANPASPSNVDITNNDISQLEQGATAGNIAPTTAHISIGPDVTGVTVDGNSFAEERPEESFVADLSGDLNIAQVLDDNSYANGAASVSDVDPQAFDDPSQVPSDAQGIGPELGRVVDTADPGATVTAVGEHDETVKVDAGQDNLIIEAGSSPVVDTTTPSNLATTFKIEGDGVTLSGFEIRSDGNAVNVVGDNALIENNEIIDPTRHGIRVGGSADVTGNTVTGSTIDDGQAGPPGPGFQGIFVATGPDGRVDITGNTLQNNDVGVGADDLSDVGTLTNNDFSDNTAHVADGDADPTPARTDILNVLNQNTFDQAAAVDDVNNSAVESLLGLSTGAIPSGADPQGIASEVSLAVEAANSGATVTAQGNHDQPVKVDAGQNNLTIEAGSSPVVDTTATSSLGTTFKIEGDGVILRGFEIRSDGNAVNVVGNNALIENNEIIDPTRHGIRVGGNGATVTGNTVSGSTLAEPGPLPRGFQGIFVASGAGASITDNTLLDNEVGVGADNLNDVTTLENNIFRNNIAHVIDGGIRSPRKDIVGVLEQNTFDFAVAVDDVDNVPGLNLPIPSGANPQGIASELSLAAAAAEEGATVTVDASPSVYNELSLDTADGVELEFLAGDAPSGDGTISGTVDEVDEDIPLGVGAQDNIDPGVGVSVHAVPRLFAFDNSVGASLGPSESASFRVRDTSTGDILDPQTDYLFLTNNAPGREGVSLTQNLSVPGFGFDAEDTDGNGGSLAVVPLEPGSYELEKSPNGSPGSFFTEATFTATRDLTFDATKQRFQNSQAVPTDVTNSQGDFELLNLYSDGERGESHIVIAGEDNVTLGFANARGYDLGTVTQDSEAGRVQFEADLSVQDTDAQADEINATDLGQIDGEGVDFDSFEEFTDFENLIDSSQPNTISRNGRQVDVIEVNTFSDGSRFGTNATVEIENVFPPAGAPPGTSPNFNGTFLDTAVGADVLDNTGDSIKIDTSPTTQGQAFVFLETDGPSPNTVFVEIKAALDNGLDDTLVGAPRSSFSGANTDFRRGKKFERVVAFDSGSITGDVTRNDEPLPETFVWTQRFQTAGQNEEVRITPDFANSPIADNFTDLTSNADVRKLNFTVEFDTTPFAPGLGPNGASITANGSELRSIDLDSRIGPVNAPDVSNFNLLRFTTPERAQYSMDRVPASKPTGVSYQRVRAVQYVTGEDGQNLVGEVRTNFTQNGDITIPGTDPLEADFQVSNLQAPGTVVEGEAFDVNATVENTGQTGDTKDVTFRLNATGEPLDDDAVEVSKAIQLDPGENTTVPFNGLSIPNDGDFDHGVFTEDDSETAAITVNDPPQANFQLSGLDPEDAEVTEGDAPIDISVDVENIGGGSGTQDLDLRIENSSGVVASDTISGVQLGPGANTTETFSGVPAGDLAPGEYDHVVSSDDDTVEGNLTVLEAPEFQVTNADASPDPVTRGDNVTISADIENVGGSGTQNIQFEVNGTGAGTGQVDVVFAIDTSGSMGPFIEDLINASQDFANNLDQSGGDPQFSVVEVNGGAAVTQNLTDNVTETENALSALCPGGCFGGSEPMYQGIDTAVNNVSLRPGANTVVLTLSDEISEGATGFDEPNQSETIDLIDDNDVKYIAVSQNYQADPSASPGKPYDPDYDLRLLADNVSDGSWFSIDSQDLEADFATEVAEEAAGAIGGDPVTLNASETDTIEFEFDTSDFVPGDVDFNITSPDDQASGTFTVEAPPTADFELSNLDPAEANVTEGSAPINISVDVDNVGNASGTQDLELTVENSSGVQFSDTVTGVQLGAGASTTVEFTNVPAGTLSVGDYDHIVSSDNDTVEGNLTVESGALFEEPLPAFPNGAPPTNTGDIPSTPNLFEDVDGDGDGLETNEAVILWSDLIQNPGAYNSLTQAQVDALDWNGDGQLTTADAVELWSEKVQASP